jgi:hypothetical protein
MKKTADEPKKRRGLWWKIPLGLLLALFVGLAVVALNIDSIAHTQINKALNRYLLAGGKLETIDIQLMAGRVELAGLTINSPPGSGPHPLLVLNEVEVDIAPLSVLSGKIVVKRVDVNGLSLVIVRDKQGRLSPMQLIPAASPTPETGAVDDKDEQVLPWMPPWIPAVHVNSMQLKELSFRLIDQLTTEQWSAALHLDLTLAGLRLKDLMERDILVDRLDLAASEIAVDQPPGFGQDPLLTVAKFELASQDIDLSASKVPVSRVMLDKPTASLERNPDGEINLLKLMDAWMPVIAGYKAKIETSLAASPAGEKPAPAFELPTLLVDDIQLKSAKVQVLDVIDGRPWRAGFDGLDILITGVEVGDLAKQAVALASFDLDIKGIAVDQPPGFSQSPLLAVDKFEMASQGIDLSTSKVSVSRVTLDTLTASLERNPDGEINLLKLMDAWMPVFEGTKAKKKTTAARSSAGKEPALVFELPTLLVDDIRLKSAKAQVLDTIDGKPWRAGFDGLDILITGVEVGDLAKQAVALASFDLDINGIAVDQPPGFSQAPLLAVDKFEMASQGIDLSTSKVSVSRVMLDKLTASLERNPNREINLLKVMDAWVPVVAGDKTKKKTTAARSSAGKKPAPAFELPTLFVDDIQLKSAKAQVLDAIDGKPWRAGFDGLDILVSGVKVGDLSKQAIALASFDLDIKGIAVDQPPGFSRNPLLAVDKFELASQGIDLSTSKVSVSKVMLDKLTASLERNPNREINLLKLMDAWVPVVAGDKTRKKTTAARSSAGKKPAPAFKLPTLFVGDIQLKSAKAQVLDAIDGKPWRAGFDGLDILVSGVKVGDLAKQAVALASLDVDLKGIAVDQPPGFGTRKLFSLDRFTVNSEKQDMSSKELIVKKVLLQGLSSSMTMRSDGSNNLQKLSEALLGSANKTRPVKQKTTAVSKTSTAAVALPTLRFEQILMDGGSVTYRDEVFAAEPLVAELNNIRMETTQLRLFAKDDGVDPASASVSFEIEQPRDLPTAIYGALATVGPVGRGIPMVNAQTRLVGLKLDTLGSLVPPATRTALGASGLDAGASLAMDANSINLIATVLTDRHILYEGLTVKGSLESPVVEVGPVLTGIYSRVADGFINIGKTGLISGVNIAEGGVDAAKELGSGTVKVGKNLVKGLFGTIAGLITLDKKKVEKGVSGTTKGTVDLTIESVDGTGKAAGGGLKSSASELKGDNRVRAWEKGIPTRYRKYMQMARDALSKMPYPPFTQ